MSDIRRLGYRLLGRGFDYLLHLRPAEWPILAGHFLTGAALAVGVSGLISTEHRGALLLGTLGFVIGLNGGTLALNSAYDRDTGDIAYLRRPPPPPRGLAGFGFGLMLLGLALSAALPPAFLAVYALCIVLSVLYSVPPFRLKARAGVDWAINLLGFGLLTPYAGWALTGAPLTPAARMLFGAFALLFGALYPLTQLYQLEADRAQGDRTFAAALGVERSLLLSILLTVFAFAGFFLAGAREQRSWEPLAVAATAWAIVLLAWWRRRARLDAAGHQQGMYRALIAWAVTDLAILLTWAS